MKIWYIYSMKHYLAVKKSENINFSATWMELKMIILNKVT